MTPDEMRRQMRLVLGAEPIPEDALERYAALCESLSQTIGGLSRDLAPEDEPGTFLAHLEQLAEAGDDS
ncbi:MAG: hypothetical protein ACE368_01315 [Paracoccaceae bacterium]